MANMQFYEIYEKGANSAVLSFQATVTKLIGSYNADDMLRRFAKYTRGTGNSMIANFKFHQATEYSRDDRTVDLNKLESDYIWNGRSAEKLAEFFTKITQLKTQRFRMQIWPTTHIIESEPINHNDMILLGGGDAQKGLTMRAGEDEFVAPMLASETHEHNKSFIEALKDIRENGIKFKKTRWDGGVNDSDEGTDEKVDLPTYCQYTTVNEGFLAVEDLMKIRAQMMNNMVDAPELHRPATLIMSPNTAAEMINNNKDKNNLLDLAVFGPHVRSDVGDVSTPQPYGFSFYQHALVPDNQIFVITPQVTVEVFDWGTTTRSKEDSDIWDITTIRRRPNYGVKVTQPLSFMHVTIKGITDDYIDDRIDNIRTTTDAPMKPIRGKAS